MGSGVPDRDGGAESGTPFVRVLRAVVCAAVERVAVVTLPVPEPLLSVLAATAAAPVVEVDAVVVAAVVGAALPPSVGAVGAPRRADARGAVTRGKASSWAPLRLLRDLTSAATPAATSPLTPEKEKGEGGGKKKPHDN